MDNEIKDELQDDIFTPNEDPTPTVENYNDDSIVHLEDMEHIRRRPGMYIGKLGDGASQDDGIYVLIKELIDNSIDEFTSGFGKKIEVRVDKAEKKVSIRDYGRGIPLGKLKEAVSQLNTGAKYDSKVFQKSVGLNGVGTKKYKGGTVWVSTKHEDKKYVVTIRDDGVGFDTEKEISGNHIGINNIRKRLEYSVNGTLDIASEIGKGTTATVIIPEKKEKKNETDHR